MLKPSMQELMKKVNNRYLLVNLTAQRARDIAIEAEEDGTVLHDKPVKIALDEIADGIIEYRPGSKTEYDAQRHCCDACGTSAGEDTAVSKSEEDK